MSEYPYYPTYRGMIFGSFKELDRFKELEKKMKQGLISDLYRNASFEICPERYGNKQAQYYIADFIYNEGGKRIAEDARKTRKEARNFTNLKKHYSLQTTQSLFSVKYSRCKHGE